MLQRLGFSDRWVELIMDCMSTVTYSIQVIKEGLAWRVGNENSIRIFHNKWIPKPCDNQYWYFKKTCKYSIKTGYRVALSQCNENFDIGGLDSSARQSFWKQLWKLEVPSYTQFLLATDSKEAVAMLKGALEWRSNLGNVVEDIRRLMADRGVVDVVFQPRDGNGAAHALA
ncbi:unnamed protein product [Prunus brigantina]